MMKRNVVIGVLALSVLMVHVPGAAAATHLATAKTLSLNYYWDGSHPSEATWFVAGDGTFTDDFGESGTWTFNGFVDTFTLTYDNACQTVYTGYWIHFRFKGTMETNGVSNCSTEGIWRAKPAGGEVSVPGRAVAPGGIVWSAIRSLGSTS
jgi:hypothetical protein